MILNQYINFLKIKKNIINNEVDENSKLKRQHFEKNKLYVSYVYSVYRL